MHVKLHSKTGFTGINPKVYDSRGEFYVREGEKSFNLPEGEFDIHDCEPLKKPIKYKLPPLPFPEKLAIMPKLESIAISIEPVEYSACIDIKNKIIYLDENIYANANSPMIYCLLAHELGHYFYSTEIKCDKFAVNYLIKYGLNPSQFVEYEYLLSKRSAARKESVCNHCEKIDKNEGKKGFFEKLFG